MQANDKSIRAQSDLQWVERVSKLMDTQFRIGNFRFGLDPLINLMPFLGDMAGAFISILLVYVMARNGVSRKVVILMLLNVLVDAVLGAIPFIGWAADFVYKANAKNVRLLHEHYYENKHQGKGTGILIAIFIVFLLILLLIFGLLWMVTFWLIDFISGRALIY
ncbi:DUF4112 domain-containing protein [Olivibacter sitiensis]|uniref:DUF4112 domain-containing protein n=1 Tax=Olivibacter sitiensis TaxID=376470 RepID=UPI0004217F5A|nr:DUF4112 domain-containing protein [Olivibacter sitiensis]